MRGINGDIYAGGNFSLFNNPGEYSVAIYDGISWGQIGVVTFDSNINTIAIGSNGYTYTGGTFQDGPGNYYVAFNYGLNWEKVAGYFNDEIRQSIKNKYKQYKSQTFILILLLEFIIFYVIILLF